MLSNIKTMLKQLHTAEELSLIKRIYSKFKHEGLAQLYTEAKKRGYILVPMDRCAVKYAGIYLSQRNLNNIIKAIGSLM